MQTENCAILTTDVLVDLAWLLDSRHSATPAEFHALNSLVEAVVFHEKLYIYDLPPNFMEPELYSQLVKENIIHPVNPEILSTELKSRGMGRVASDMLSDSYYGLQNISYHPEDGAATLSSLVEYEKNLGFDRMSRMRDSSREFMIPFFAGAFDFSEEEAILADDTYRRARAFSVCASELDLEMYTGIIMRPFVLGFLSSRRRGSLALYDMMRKELDDFEETDLPSWERFDIPPLTQVLLHNCQDSPDAIPNELLKLRNDISKFRNTLTERARYFKEAKTRGEKRKIRLESEKAWNALLELDKKDRSTRLLHEFIYLAIDLRSRLGEKVIELDTLNQATLKWQGLTDLWRIVHDAPTIEQNMKLVKNLFQIDVKHNKWDSIAQPAKELEIIMTRNTEPNLPNIE